MRLSRLLIAAMVGALFAGHAGVATATDVIPTESEWTSWPEYCRVRFAVSGTGQNTEFASRISAADLKLWEDRMGAAAWYALHHYCYGLIHLSRAPTESEFSPHYRYNEAASEFGFIAHTLPKTDPFWPEVAVHLGLANEGLGDAQAASRYYSELIEQFPHLDKGYVALGAAYRKLGKLDQAERTLTKGVAETEGGTAELHYFLGMVYFDMHRYPEARKHAVQAYQLGYPLPGLRNKLSRIGEWTPTSANQ